MDLTKEIHTLIVWSKASQVVPDVEMMLKDKFNLLSQFEICWSKDKFLDNLKIFYSHSQKHCSEVEYDNILARKIEHCGDEPFTLFIYEDDNPFYDYRITSSGNRKVNTNVFDCKKELRQGLGGGHKIHASDNIFESNKDLTLLLGINIQDFLIQQLKIKQNKAVLNQNCIGVDGYENIEQLFYVLNNSIKYCVLRNYECLPKEYTIEGHGDIDLLVEDLNYIKYLTLAKSYYPDLNYRVHYGINISNKLIPFDFRYVGDDYYDINWQNQILNNLVLYNSLVKVPNTINYFYTLLYHAYVQKSAVKADYFERLDNMSKELDMTYKSDLSLDKIKEKLDEFMIQNSFNYTIPKDKTVYFNQLFLNFDNSRVNRFGKLISSQQARLDDAVLFTEVYDNGTEIIKFGSELIIRNEIKFLTILKDSSLTPEVYSTNLEPNNYFLKTEKIKGVPLNQAIENSLFWTKKNVISFLSQCALFNKVLIDHGILHRDIKPENILVGFNNKKEIEIKLIDFGWSTLIAEMNNTSNPLHLGSKYKYAEGHFSDLYSTMKILDEIFKGFQFRVNIKNGFCFKPNAYGDVTTLKLNFIRINNSLLNSEISLSFRDVALLTIIRNKLLFGVLLKIKRILRIKVNN